MKLKTKIENINDMKNISGSHNSNLKVLEEKFECSIDIHGESILCSCDDELTCDTLDKIFTLLVKMSQLSFNITSRDIVYVCNIVLNSLEGEYLKFLQNRKAIGHSFHNKPIYAKTLKQQDYIDLLDKKDLIFSIVAAGTGKTYLAVCYAVNQLKKGNIDKIILTRPAVEAGESLGFLPGDLKEKVDPYLRPLYDA